jgi:diguanylate cyclase (GGDEF)-like protein
LHRIVGISARLQEDVLLSAKLLYSIIWTRMDFEPAAVTSHEFRLELVEVLRSVRLPIAILSGTPLTFQYANPAFCSFLGRSAEQVIGVTFSDSLPQETFCLGWLRRALSEGRAGTVTAPSPEGQASSLWSYEVWPVWRDFGSPAVEGPVAVVLLVTETSLLHRRKSSVNEALLLATVEQHALIEETRALNERLEAEIVERKRAEQEIERLAFYDALTGLPNRRLLLDRLHHASLACARTLHHGAVLFIDLDRFKTLNDTRGHKVGDLLLQQVASRLAECVREEDTAGRLGGDEFVIVLESLSPDAVQARAQASMIAQKIVMALAQSYVLLDQEHRCSASIGIEMFSKEKDSVEALLARADHAQYQVKSSGGGAVQFFRPG